MFFRSWYFYNFTWQSLWSPMEFLFTPHFYLNTSTKLWLFLLQICPQDKLPWTKFISIQNKLPLRTKFISIQKMKTQMETAKDNADGNSYRVSPQQWLQWWWQYSWLMVVCGLCDDNINSSPLCVTVSVKERWKETGGSS